MEEQLRRPSDHSHEDGRSTHSVGGEDGDEKKSVLKKVKDKAKKIIKKHGHGHHHHEDDDDDEDHQVHGAPTFESTVVRSVTLPNNSPNTRQSTPTAEHKSDHHLDMDTTPGNPELKDKGQDSIKKMGMGETMKEYLKPGEEDKALSQVITEALQKKKKEPKTKRGKVTVSKEVAERLGMEQKNKREGEDAVAAGEESTGQGQGVAERLQNAVAAWLGKSNGIQTAQDSLAHAFVSDATGGRHPH